MVNALLSHVYLPISNNLKLDIKWVRKACVIKQWQYNVTLWKWLILFWATFATAASITLRQTLQDGLFQRGAHFFVHFLLSCSPSSVHLLSARRHGQNHIVGIVVYYQWPVSRAPRNDNINLPSFLWHVLHVRSSLSFNVTNGTRTHTLDIDSHLELKLCRGKQTTRTLVTWACACRHEPGHLQRFEQQPRHAD